MAVIEEIVGDGVEPGHYWFKCQGCGQRHTVQTKTGSLGTPWGFNGNVDRPTFTPSVLVRWGKHADPKWQAPDGQDHWSGICHFYVRNGFQEFLTDCTHALAGRTVVMPEIEDNKH